MKAAGVKILRWQRSAACQPYDPEWELYLEERLAWKLGHTLAGRGRIVYLWKEQQGSCLVCGQALQPKSNPGTSTIGSGTVEGGRETCDNLEVLHANCHRQVHSKSESLKNAAASREGR